MSLVDRLLERQIKLHNYTTTGRGCRLKPYFQQRKIKFSSKDYPTHRQYLLLSRLDNNEADLRQLRRIDFSTAADPQNLLTTITILLFILFNYIFEPASNYRFGSKN